MSISRLFWWAELTVVEGDHVKGIEQLSLVLVNPLHMHIKHGVWVDLDSMGRLQVGSKLLLVLLKVQKYMTTQPGCVCK